jgi:hypothetical protein
MNELNLFFIDRNISENIKTIFNNKKTIYLIFKIYHKKVYNFITSFSVT